MNKVAWIAVMLPLSIGAYAETGGYEAGKTPPPQNKEEAGYKGSEDTAETPVTLIKDFRQGGYVTLEGYIVKKRSKAIHISSVTAQARSTSMLRPALSKAKRTVQKTKYA